MGVTLREATGLQLFKLVLAAATIAATVFIMLPKLQHYLTYNEIPDQGKRGLIIVSSSGSDRDYKLVVRQNLERGGKYDLVFFLTSEGTEYGEATNTRLIDVRITFVGTNFAGGVACGKSTDPVPRQSFDDLAPGTQRAMRVDAAGGSASAINYNGETAQGDEALKAQNYPTYSTKLWLLKPEANYSYRVPSSENDETMWAEACTLPENAVWGPALDESLTDSLRRTLVPPQINFTAIGENTDFQKAMQVRINVERAQGEQLVESYPPVETSDDDWSYNAKSYWAGDIGKSGNIGYTDQPVLIFSNRSDADTRALFLMWSGIALGLLATLALFVVSTSISLAWQYFRGE
jgi:hypothetical protein